MPLIGQKVPFLISLFLSHSCVAEEDELKQKYGERVTSYIQDVTDADSCKATVLEIAAKHGGSIHTLVNTAAYFGSKGNLHTY